MGEIGKLSRAFLREVVRESSRAMSDEGYSQFEIWAPGCRILWGWRAGGQVHEGMDAQKGKETLGMMEWE